LKVTRQIEVYEAGDGLNERTCIVAGVLGLAPSSPENRPQHPPRDFPRDAGSHRSRGASGGRFQDALSLAAALPCGSEEDVRQRANGRLRGAQIEFSVGSTKYTGTVNGSTMTGKTSSGQAWSATK